MGYRLLNYKDSPESGNHSHEAFWENVGSIIGSHLDLDTVVWPGHTIFGPTEHAREFFTIVTRPAEPFVYIRGPVMSKNECSANTACLEVFTYDPEEITEAVMAFRSNINNDRYYLTHCCDGVVVDILHSLSVDLKFDFVMYFKNDSNYGSYSNGTWNGMVSDVINGAADILAGAVSVTSGRLEGIDFTESFYYSSFNMVTSAEEKRTTLFAFLNPFDSLVWVTIVSCVFTVALVTSLFEWNSPFGLNPWGKKRERNYTLGSALTMVFSIWFGNTVVIKSPKSWPSKWLQNIWAATALILLAGYTANLAAFLAGSAFDDPGFSILDSKVRTLNSLLIKTGF